MEIFNLIESVDGLYERVDDIVNGKVVYMGVNGDRAIFHDLKNWAIGKYGAAAYVVRSHIRRVVKLRIPAYP